MSHINNIRLEVNNNNIRLHWQMAASNGSLLWKHKTLVIRVYVEPFDKFTLPEATLHHMNAASREVDHGFEASLNLLNVGSITGTRSETIGEFNPSGRYNSTLYGSWHEIKIDVNHEKVSKQADHIAPYLEWDVAIDIDFTLESELGHIAEKNFVSDTDLVRYEHNPNQIDEYLKQLTQYVEAYLDWQIIAPLDIGGSSKRQKPMMNLRFSPRLEQHLKNAPFDDFNKVFEQLDNRVVLLGEAGAGKTITALLHVEQAIKNREANPDAPLPIYARIPEWLREQLPLHEWLAKATPLNPSTVKGFLESGQCLLILDGLDELGDEVIEKEQEGHEVRFDPRKRFLETVNTLSSKNRLLITCRSDDYNQIGVEVQEIGGKINLKRLENRQIESYLNSSDATKPLWIVLKPHPKLLEITRTPLLLSLFAFAFRDLPEEVRKLNDLAVSNLRNIIFDQYVQKRYQHEVERYQLRGEIPPFTLKQLHFIFGNIAMSDISHTPKFILGANRNALTGGIVLSKSIPFADAVQQGGEMLNSAIDEIKKHSDHILRLNILTHNGDIRFIHNLLRDYIVVKFVGELFKDKKEGSHGYAIYQLAQLSRFNQFELLVEIVETDWFSSAIEWGQENWQHIDKTTLKSVISVIQLMAQTRHTINVEWSIADDLEKCMEKIPPPDTSKQ